jgi:hypothetical protein
MKLIGVDISIDRLHAHSVMLVRAHTCTGMPPQSRSVVGGGGYREHCPKKQELMRQLLVSPIRGSRQVVEILLTINRH